MGLGSGKFRDAFAFPLFELASSVLLTLKLVTDKGRSSDTRTSHGNTICPDTFPIIRYYVPGLLGSAPEI